jgi:hypothetical protein
LAGSEPTTLSVANSQYDGIRLCRAALRALALMVRFAPMRELLILAIHLLVTFARLLRPGGVRGVAAESLLLKHQLLISNRSRQRAPNLTTLDRSVLGLGTLFVSPRRIAKLGALVKPATLFKFHKSLVNRKYRLLFSASAHRGKPGPKGPSAELIAAIVELKCRNPKFGCVRIAEQISHAFGVDIDKDVVRRVLEIEEVKSVPYPPGSDPFVERLIGTIRRELLDQTFFWNALDLARKLESPLLQRASCSSVARGDHAGATHRCAIRCPGHTRSICLAAALPRAVSDVD